MTRLTTSERYARAGYVAEMAMGPPRLKKSTYVNAADEDPLAWWLLTEMIANISHVRVPIKRVRLTGGYPK